MATINIARAVVFISPTIRCIDTSLSAFAPFSSRTRNLHTGANGRAARAEALSPGAAGAVGSSDPKPLIR
jgi:hypothetical protein